MTFFRRELVLFLIVLALASSINPVGLGVGARAENSIVPNQVANVNGFPDVLPSSGCFGVSTRIPGVEGDFAVVAMDNVGGVYVAYQSLWIDNSSNPYVHVYFAYSHDYGASWSDSFRVDDDESPSVQCDSPSITVDQLTGHVFVAWKDNRTGVAKVYIDKSIDRGVSFGSDITVYDWPSDRVAMGLPFTVNIKVDDGKIYAAWIAYYSDSYTDCDIFLAQSIDGGQTFNAPVIVNLEEGTARLLHPWIAIDNASVLYVAYSRRNSTFSGVYLTRSLNEGSSFEVPVKVNDDSTARYRGGTQVNVSPDGKIHVTWTDSRAGDGSQYLDIYYATSLNGGLSFEPNIRVNDDHVMSPPDGAFARGAQGTPSIVTDSDSRVHIVWEDFRNFENDSTYCRDIYYASSEEGVRFSENVKVNSVNPDADSVNCADPSIAIDSQDNFFIVYSDAPSGDNDHPQIYFIFAPAHDAAVVNIDPSKTKVGRGLTCRINVTITNQGGLPGTFNLSIYANGTSIASQIVGLNGGTSGILTYQWNTTAFAIGKYTLSAYAWPVYGETDLANNALTSGTVQITKKGDINADGKVNVLDLIIVAMALGATPSSPKWNPNADLNNDNIINVLDLILIASQLGT